MQHFRFGLQLSTLCILSLQHYGGQSTSPVSASSVTSSVSCPSVDCRCHKLLTSGDLVATCQRSVTGLPVFQAARHATIAGLSITHARLTSIPPASFASVSVKSLDFSGNEFGRHGIPDGAFKSLENVLQVLVLNDCQLVRVPAAIGHLSRLQNIQLDDNKIQQLKRTHLKRNTALTHVSLRHNTLLRIDADAFESLLSLRELELSHNQLTSLSPRVFSSLVNLTTLDLSDNFLHQLQAGTFSGLQRLVWLDLASNSLHVVVPATFHGLGLGLQYLALDRNPLQQIDGGALSNLQQLQSLSFDVTSVGLLSDDVLSGLTSLRTLVIGKLTVDSLPTRLFAPLANLRYLSVNTKSRRVSAGRHLGVLRPDHFGAEMDFERLSIWVGSIYQCRCSAAWIRLLLQRGAALHGQCGNHQQIQCTIPHAAAATLPRRRLLRRH